MIRFFILLLFITSLFGAEVKNYRWLNGETYLVFLERIKLPTKILYYELEKDDQRLTEEMRAGVNYQILRDANGGIEHLWKDCNSSGTINIQDMSCVRFKLSH